MKVFLRKLVDMMMMDEDVMGDNVLLDMGWRSQLN